MGDLVPGIVADIRRACWLFVRRPGLLVAVVVTMALGIGANTAIFAVARSVLLRPLPYGSPERLVMLWRTNRDGSRSTAGSRDVDPRHGMACAQHGSDRYCGLWICGRRARQHVWIWSVRMAPNSSEGPTQRGTSSVSSACRRCSAVRSGDDDADDVVVLSDALWRRRFGADPDVVGTTVDLTAGDPNRELGRFTIIGVLPARFRFTYPQETELWAPLGADDLSTASLALRYTVVARLKAGRDVRRFADRHGRGRGGDRAG